MKILIATGIYPPQIGGPATYSKLLFDEMPPRGIDVEVLNFGDVLHLPKGIRHAKYFFQLLKKGKNADVIYALDPISVGFPTMFASTLLRKIFFLRIAGDYAWEQAAGKYGLNEALDEFVFQKKKYPLFVEVLKFGERMVAKRAERIIVPSAYLKKIVTAWGVNADKITVIYNAHEKKETEGLPQKNTEGNVIISAGRLVPWKGFSLLIEIMPDLLREFPQLELHIIGSGPEGDRLLRKRDELGLEKNIFFFGALPQKELLERIAAARLFVLNTGYEGFSHQLLEVMECGTPLITTTSGGNPETIENGKEGILVSYNSRPDLIDAILSLLRDPEKGRSMAGHAKEKVKQFSKERMLDDLVKLLSQ